jgi:hypothetical protein
MIAGTFEVRLDARDRSVGGVEPLSSFKLDGAGELVGEVLELGLSGVFLVVGRFTASGEESIDRDSMVLVIWTMGEQRWEER